MGGHRQALQTYDSAKAQHAMVGGVAFLQPEGTDACCGFVCCPPDGGKVAVDPQYQNILSSYMDNMELENFITEINQVLKATHAPVFPCFMLHMVGVCYIVCQACKREQGLNNIISTANAKLVEKKAAWKMVPCQPRLSGNCETSAAAMMFVLCSTDPSNMGLANPQQQMLLMQQQMLAMQQQLAGQTQVVPMQPQIQMQGQPQYQQVPMGAPPPAYGGSGLQMQTPVAAPVQQPAPVQPAPSAPMYRNTGSVS